MTRRRRGAALAGACVAAMLALGAGLGWVALRTAPGRAWVAARVVSQVDRLIPGRLELDAFVESPLDAPTFRGVRFLAPGRAGTALSVREVRVRWAWRDLLGGGLRFARVELDEVRLSPDLLVAAFVGPATGGRSDDAASSAPNLHVDTVVVNGARVAGVAPEIAHVEGSFDLERGVVHARGVRGRTARGSTFEAALRVAPDARPVDVAVTVAAFALTAADAQALWPALPALAGPVTGAGRLSGSVERLTAGGRVSLPGGAQSATGRWDGTRLTASARLRALRPRALLAAPPAELPDAELTADVDAWYEPADARGGVRVELERVRVTLAAVPLDASGRVDARLERGELRLESATLALDGGGTLDARGTYALATGHTTFEARAADVVLPALAPPGVPLRAGVLTSLALEVDGVWPDGLTVAGDGALDDVVVSALSVRHATLRVDGPPQSPRVTLDARELSAPPLRLERLEVDAAPTSDDVALSVRASAAGGRRYTASAVLTPLATARPVLRVTALTLTRGAARWRLERPASLSLGAAVSASPLRLRALDGAAGWLEVAGTLGPGRRLDSRLAARRLDVASLTSVLPLDTPAWPATAGRLDATVEAHGALPVPESLDVDVALRGVTLAGLDRLDAHLVARRADGDFEGRLAVTRGGATVARGSGRLAHPGVHAHPGGPRPFEVSVSMPGVPLALVAPLLPAALVGTRGTLVGALRARGSLDAPVVDAELTVARLDHPLGPPVSLHATLAYADGAARVALEGRRADEPSAPLLDASATLPVRLDLEHGALRFAREGRVEGALHLLRADLAEWSAAWSAAGVLPALSGSASGELTLRGTPAAPHLRLSFELVDAAAPGVLEPSALALRPAHLVGEAAWSSGALTGRLEAGTRDLAAPLVELSFEVPVASTLAWPLARPTVDIRGARATVRVPPVELTGPLAALLPEALRLGGVGHLDARVVGGARGFEVETTAGWSRAATAQAPAATLDARLSARDGGAQLTGTVVVAHANRATVDASAGVDLTLAALRSGRVLRMDAPCSLVLDAPSVSLSAATGLLPVGAALDGVLALRLTATGTPRAPRLDGEASVRGGSVRLGADLPTWTLDTFRATARGGDVAVEALELRDARGGTLSATAALKFSGAEPTHASGSARVRDFTVLDGARASARVRSALLTLTGDATAGPRWLRVEGDVQMGRVEVHPPGFDEERALLAARLPPDVVRARIGDGADDGARAHARSARPEAEGELPLPRWLALDVAVALPGEIRVKNRNVESALGGHLRVYTLADHTLVEGELRALRGSVDVQGHSFDLERAVVTFAGADVEDPSLDIVAARVLHVSPAQNAAGASEVTVRIVVGGTAREPQLAFESTPAFPESDVMSLILFGRTSEQLSGGQSAAVESQAVALAGNFAVTALVEHLPVRVPVDVLRLTAADGDGEGKGGGALGGVEVGRYLARDLYVGYHYELGGTRGGRHLVRGEYTLLPSVQLASDVADDGSGAVELVWEFRPW